MSVEKIREALELGRQVFDSLGKVSAERKCEEAIAHLEAQSAELARLRGMGWQPIGDEHKDGKPHFCGWRNQHGGKDAMDWAVFRNGVWWNPNDDDDYRAPDYCIALPQFPEPPAALASRNGGGGV